MKAGSLAFSVIMYTVTACVCIAMLMARRYLPIFGEDPHGPGELGGKKSLKTACAVLFVFLWFFYVLMSAMEAYGHIEGV